MYTGIITDIGRIRSVDPGGVTRFVVETAWDTGALAIGASVALSGPCFTVVERGPGWFAVEASRETLDRTTCGAWERGTRLNLERSLGLGDEMGGHYVTGHVDATVPVTAIAEDGASRRFRFRAPAGLAGFVAPKGSVALDGVSLTVNDVEDAADGSAVFGVNIIPHTLAHTTFADRAVGDRVNMEADMFARYVARLHRREEGAALPALGARAAAHG